MSKDEALKLALEALENHCGNYKLDDAGCKRWNKAVAAIKEALAQPEEEKLHPFHIGVDVTKEGTAVTAFYRKHDAAMEMFYSQFHPLEQPEQEPVAWEQFYPDIGKPQLKQEPVAIYRAGQAKGEGFHVEFLKEMGDDETLLYTTPPQRPWGKPWVSLTDEEISQLWISTSPYFNEDDFAKAVGAKLKAVNGFLKEKNT
jgi:hypothetical protein